MKQVLLSCTKPKPSAPPVRLWMPDDAELGDTFSWRGHTYVVSAVYTTRFSACGTECRKTEFPRSHRAHGVILDQRGGESQGVPGAPAPAN